MAAIRFGTRIDLQNNEVLNMVFQKVNGLPTPTAALTGAARFNTADGRFYICDGSAWHLKATNADAVQGFSPAQLRDRNTHTGTQPAASIADLEATVLGYPVSSFAAATGILQMGNQRITGLASGTANTDAVTKAQLDQVRSVAESAAAGVAIKAPVVAVATTNISITTPPTAVDGITIPTNGRILLTGQTVAAENGIYTRPANGALVRAVDADTNGELAPGTQVYVTQGLAHGDSAWVIISDAAITVGTTAQAWTRVPGSSGGANTFGLGLEVIGTEVRVRPGTGIIVSGGATAIDTAIVPRMFKYAIPAGTSPVAVSHGLNTRDVICQVQDITNGDLVLVGITVTGTNTVSIDFGVNPTSNQYRLLVIG